MRKSKQDNQARNPQIKSYLQDVSQQYRASNLTEKAIKVEVAGLDRERQYKVCSLVKAQKTEQAYRDINNMVTVNANKEAGLVVDQSKQLAKDSSELAKGVQTAVKKMKELREKLKAVHAEACNLKSCVSEEQSCNLKLYEAIKGEVSSAKLKADDTNTKLDLEDLVNAIHHKTEHLQDLAMTAFSTGVDIACIQTFSYIESLGPLADQLNGDMSKLKSDVDANLAFADGKVDSAQSDLNTILENLSQMQINRYAADSEQEGLRRTKRVIWHMGTDEMDCDSPEDRRRKIHEICDQVNDIFTAKVNSPEDLEEKENWDLPDEKDMGQAS